MQIPRFDKQARERAAEQLNRLVFEDRVKDLIRIHVAKFEAQQQQNVSIGELAFQGDLHLARADQDLLAATVKQTTYKGSLNVAKSAALETVKSARQEHG